MSVNLYEIELRVTTRATGEQRLDTRREHAYGVLDAIQQAVFNHPDADPDRYVFKVTHVGPPREAIEAATVDLASQVERSLAAVLRARQESEE